jgi:hypothetical protein
MRRCAICTYDLRTCALGPELGCAILVHLTALGDLVSLTRASEALARGDEVDQVDVTLAFVGLGATGLVVLSGGTFYTVKLGAGFLKVAHRTGQMSAPLRRVLQRGFREGVDWARLPAIRKTDDLRQVARMDALRPALEVTEAMGMMRAQLGTRGALYLVGHVDTVSDARRMANATQALGPRSVGTLELLGKQRFLRVGVKIPRLAIEAFLGLMVMLSAALGLVGSAILLWLRRFARSRLRNQCQKPGDLGLGRGP